MTGRGLAALARLLGAPLGAAGAPPEAADAIVILGAPLRADGSLSEAAAERVRVGAALWQRGLAPVVCVTGGHTPWTQRASEAEGMARFVRRLPSGRARPPAAGPEAEGMARFVRRLGVPDACLRVDRRATSTAENAARAAELLLPEGRRRVWLVTQPFHLRRACHLFRRAGFEPLPWHDHDSLQYREPRFALRWITREYGSWGLLFARRLVGYPPRRG